MLIFWHRHAGINEQLGGAPEITSAQILARSFTTDCWTSIGGSVYDLTNYFAKHPDSNFSGSLCGQTTSKAELPSNLTADTLLSYRIGVLAP